jgi:hypothetical protein
MAKRVINTEVGLPNEIEPHLLEEIENWMAAEVWVATNTNAECAMHHVNWTGLAGQLNPIIDQAAAWQQSSRGDQQPSPRLGAP